MKKQYLNKNKYPRYFIPREPLTTIVKYWVIKNPYVVNSRWSTGWIRMPGYSEKEFENKDWCREIKEEEVALM